MSRSSEVRDAAIELFYEQGYPGTSLKDIARVLELRAPSLYNHMESKQKLLEEIMFDGATSVIDQFDTVTAQATDVVERISLAAEVLARYNIQRRTQAYVNAYETRSLEEPARSRLLDRRREYQARWASLIEDAIREGRAAQGEPRLMARYITDAGSAISRWYRPDGEWSEDEVVAHFRSSTMRMLACTPPAKPPRKRAKTSTPA